MNTVIDSEYIQNIIKILKPLVSTDNISIEDIPSIISNIDIDNKTISDYFTGEIDLGMYPNLESIDYGAFCMFYRDFAGLESIKIPDTVKYIKALAFAEINIDYIEIPNSVIYIGEEAFRGTSSKGIKSIRFMGDSVDLGASVFSNYEKNPIQFLNIPRVGNIGYEGFKNCSNLTDVHLTDKCRVIDSNAFYYCTNLQNIEIDEGLEFIYNSAFYECTSLTSITLPSSVKFINSMAFDRSYIKTININKPANSISGAPWGASKPTINWLG